ncbi:MAG: hypothetical protein ABIG44_15515 [Planctomycetota bacterium]
MSVPVSVGFLRVRLLVPPEPYALADLVVLDSAYAARTFLARFLPDAGAMATIRAFLVEQTHHCVLREYTDQDIVAALAEKIARHEVLVIRERQAAYGDQGRAAPAPEAVLAAPGEAEEHWIKIKVVHDLTSEPIPGVKLRVRLPNGKLYDQTTRPDGMIEINGIDPGTCDVTCPLRFGTAKLTNTFDYIGLGETTIEPSEIEPPPTSADIDGQYIADIEEHKVHTGETLESLAASAEMTWQELALFNWDTSSPAKINEHLYDDIGCTKKTADGYNYVFDDTDHPGIVYIPREFSEEGLAVDQTHTLRVKKRDGFRVILQNEQELRVPEAEFEATLADGSKRRGRIGRTGVAILKDVPPGEVTVEWLDFDDIESKSLAACTRDGFKRRDTEEALRLLRHSPTMIKQAVKAYDTYYNDHTGQGLIEDIYQEFPDERSQLTAEIMMKVADLPTRRKIEVEEFEDPDNDEQYTDTEYARADMFDGA